jgi:peptidoglycan/LPS O-acetylase OafA/YrhL
MVVLFHAVNRSSEYRIMDVSLASDATTLGGLGVTFFFVLSGFVLTWSARPGDGAREFYRRRFARIYPMHALTWAAAVVAIMAGGEHVPFVGAIMSLSLLQSWIPNPDVYVAANGVSWSLSCEAFFYAVFPFLLAALIGGRWSMRRVGATALAAMTSLAIAQAVTGAGFPRTADLLVFPPFAIGTFVVGVAAAVAFRNGLRVRLGVGRALAIAAGWLGLMTLFALQAHSLLGIELPSTFATIVVTPAVVLLILSAASTDVSERRSLFSSHAMVKLGEWSFALYMTHALILRALVRVLHVTPPHGLLPSVALLSVYVASAIAVSWLACWLVERPIERRLRPIFRTLPIPAPAPA